MKKIGRMYEISFSTPSSYIMCEFLSNKTKFKDGILTDGRTEISLYTYRGIQGIVIQSTHITNSFMPLPPALYEDIDIYFSAEIVQDHEFEIPAITHNADPHDEDPVAMTGGRNMRLKTYTRKNNRRR